MPRPHRIILILQVSVWTSLLLATPTAHAGETWCSAEDEALPVECFPDVRCPQYSNYVDYRRAVVHISGPDFWGTGVLINNAKCEVPDSDDPDCGQPYVLTAAHLVTNVFDPMVTPGDIQALENEATFTLGYEAVICGGNTAYSWEFAISGAKVLLEDEAKDLLLLRLATAFPAEAGPYFVGWGDEGYDEVAAITHACSGAKKIALTEHGWMDYVDYWAFRKAWIVHSWEVGGVLGGSSGGPLLTEKGKLIGVYTNNLIADNFCSGGIQESVFTSDKTFVPFLQSITSNYDSWGAYDPDVYLPDQDVELNSEKYGPGEVVRISARQEVVLSNGFHAEAGSDVHVIIVPAGP